MKHTHSKTLLIAVPYSIVSLTRFVCCPNSDHPMLPWRIASFKLNHNYIHVQVNVHVNMHIHVHEYSRAHESTSFYNRVFSLVQMLFFCALSLDEIFVLISEYHTFLFDVSSESLVVLHDFLYSHHLSA